jgi:hypothetical protein
MPFPSIATRPSFFIYRAMSFLRLDYVDLRAILCRFEDDIIVSYYRLASFVYDIKLLLFYTIFDGYNPTPGSLKRKLL